MNTNVGEMPLEVFVDYSTELTGLEWNIAYLLTNTTMSGPNLIGLGNNESELQTGCSIGINHEFYVGKTSYYGYGITPHWDRVVFNNGFCHDDALGYGINWYNDSINDPPSDNAYMLEFFIYHGCG